MALAVDVDVVSVRTSKTKQSTRKSFFVVCLLLFSFFLPFCFFIVVIALSVCVTHSPSLSFSHSHCVSVCKSTWPSALLEVDVRGLLYVRFCVFFQRCEFYAQVDCEVF